ncbi:cobalamin synthase, partial [Pseudomonas syringae pv. actinidiae ICMP 18807]
KVLLVSAVACVVLAGGSGIAALLVCAVCFYGLRHMMMRRLGGSTGDTAGALLELLELAVLLTLALL